MKNTILAVSLILLVACGGSSGSSANTTASNNTSSTANQDVAEQFNGLDVVHLTTQQTALWAGTYLPSSTTCAADATLATIIITGDSPSTASVSVHYADTTNHFTGTFVDGANAGVDGDLLMWNGQTYNGMASTDATLVAGKQMLDIQFTNKNNLTDKCNEFFTKE